jgi:predicted Zn-dependent protease with MMP-like domain/Flp pilus assembly protein TadD
MPSADRLAAELDAGFSALEAGRLDDAEAALGRARKLDREDPDVVALGAGVADARGNTEDAVALYSQLVELRPDDPLPRICTARLELAQGDPEAALETIAAAFDYIDEEADLVEAILVRSEAMIATDDRAGAREALAELSTSAIDDPDLALQLASLALDAEDLVAAKRWIEIVRKAPNGEADALHLLARVHEAKGDRKNAIAAWKRVLELDTAAETPEGAPTITDDELEKLALAALAELPEEVREKLEEVPILIDALPSVHMVEDGLDPRMLGVFEGTPLPEAGGGAPSVTRIVLFKTNLERSSADRDELAAEVRVTVLHETAHYFGLDEEDLEALGLD